MSFNLSSKLVEYALDHINGLQDIMLMLETLRKKLRSLSAKGSDIEEEIKNAELSGRKKRKREVDEWLGEVEYIKQDVVEFGRQVESAGFVMMLTDGGKAARLNEQVEKLLQQSLNFGEPVLDACESRGETLLTDEIVGEAFKENLERILKLLEDKEVSKIGVYGMGGMGKTTLAKHVYNRLVQQSQGRVFWITVSQEFTITSLQGKIAQCLGVDLSDEDEEWIRASRLHRAFSRMKNSVLILDDVWKYFDMQKVGCPVSMDCCRLIITTRITEVCRRFGCQKVFSVEKLREDEAWKLFNVVLKNEIELGSQVEEIAKSMAKLCDGLPLGIIAIAGNMRGETAIHRWKNALTELQESVVGLDGMGDNVFKVLKYSFDQLKRNDERESNDPSTIQRCFLYCSLYPEDYEIPVEDLVREFISEGLVDQRKSRKEQFNRGHSILDKLVNTCLLESCDGYDDVEFYGRVRMHDLVRSMALKISEGKYMVRSGDESLIEIPDKKEWTKDLEKASLMKSGIRLIRDGTSPNCPKLSTLILCGNPLKVIPNSFFSKMQGLCTLDLCETRIKRLPESVCDMTSLKVLLLANCSKLVYVSYMGKLKALRELNLSGTTIKQVPQGLEELFNLKLLSMHAHMLNMLPRGLLLKLEHLQHINVPFHVQVSLEEFKDLKQLEEFSGGVRKVDDFNCFIRSRVRDTCYRIGVRSHCSDPIGGGSFGWYNNELVLCECNLQDEKVLGQSIVYLTITKCEGLSTCFMDGFSRLDNPRFLKKLRIESCGEIECISSSEQIPQISSLEYIELVELEGLEELIQRRDIGASAGHAIVVFSCLKRLVISNCNKLRKLGFPVSGTPSLECIDIRGCEEIEEIFEDEEGRASATLPNLKELRLYDLPRLEKVCNATIICKSISEIFIVKCPGLTNNLPLLLDDPLPPTLGLGAIKVEREWWESLEWTSIPTSPDSSIPLFICTEVCLVVPISD